MTTLEPKAGGCVMDVRVTEDAISVALYDGRNITIPIRGAKQIKARPFLKGRAF